MPGAGKSTIADGLRARGFDVVVMGDAIREEAKRRNLEPTHSNFAIIMMELRKKNGPGAIAELTKPKILQSKSDVILVDGVRSNDEIASLSDLGVLKILAVHASTDNRFEFLKTRKRYDDPHTRDHFDQRDSRELSVGINDSIALSDYVLSNDGLTKKGLVDEAFRVISKWQKDLNQLN